MSDSCICVLVADAHSLVRAGIVHLISTESDMVVVAQAADAGQACTLALKHRPDVILVDLGMLSADSPVTQLRNALPQATIITIANEADSEEIARALRWGADGCLPKSVTPGEFAFHIREALQGRPPLDGLTMRHLVDNWRKYGRDVTHSCAMGRNIRYPRLTQREIDVLSLVARGAKNWEIGSRLSVSENTVKNHLKAVLAKLRVVNRAQAVAVALRMGLLPGHD